MHTLRCRSAYDGSARLGTLTARAAFTAVLLAFSFSFVHAADALTWQEKEEFLAKGKITRVKSSKKGVTGTSVVTLTNGTITHDASVQTIDEFKQFFLGEIGFKDTYKFYIAGWKLARLVGIEDMVPPSVKRSYEGKTAAYTWWIDNFLMDEIERKAKNAQPPDADAWEKENNIMQVFDQLIYNMDRNQTNMLIDQSWHLWLIDPGRGFRVHKTLRNPAALKTVDRTMLAKMKTLDEATLIKEFGRDVTKEEVRALLARRDLIVKFFEDKGESALFDRPQRN